MKKRHQRHQRIAASKLGKQIPAEFRIQSSGSKGTGLKASERDDAGRVKSFTMLAYTGGRLLLAEFDHPVVVDLQGMQVPRTSIPILRNHDHDRIVGHTTQIEVGRQRIELGGLISAANDCAREVAESAGNGFPWECSIGARATRMVFVKAGDSIRVNGQVFDGPLYVATKSVLKETSFVAIGADEDGATATVAASAAKEGTVMTNRYKAWLREKGFNPKNVREKQNKVLQAAYRAEKSGNRTIQASDDEDDEDDVNAEDDEEDNVEGEDGENDDDVNAEDDEENNVEGEDDENDDPKPVKASGKSRLQKPQSVKAAGHARNNELQKIRSMHASEATRVRRINQICAKYPNVKLKSGRSLAEKAIEAGWSAERTELAAMRNSRPKAPAAHIKGGQLESGKAIEAALLMSTSHSEEFCGKHYDEKVMNAALSKEYRGMTMHALMAKMIHAAGHHYAGSHKSNDFIRAMKAADRELQGSGFSTLRVSNILENVANKSMIASYQAQETTWQHFTARKSYSDFKPQSRYRLDAKGAFRKVGPDGELKHVGLTDAKYTNQLDTFGAIITLNRQMIVNDDLDAFLEIPKLLGTMSPIRIEEAFYTLLLSNTGNFFHTSNRNLLTGTTSAFDIDALTLAETKFSNQITPNGKPLLVSAKKLLVPTTLKTDADNIYAEKLLIPGTNTAVQPARNPHVGKYAPIQSAYLNNTSITDQDGLALTGQSDTAWFLFADPNVLAAVIIGFLNGQATPVIESDDTPFDTLGMQWRGYHDFGVAFEDPNAALKAAGA